MVATTLAAALARAAGVDFAVEDGEQTIPLSGIAFVTGFFSVVGVVIAVAMRRWSARPAERFVRTTLSLTALSLVPSSPEQAPPLPPPSSGSTPSRVGDDPRPDAEPPPPHRLTMRNGSPHPVGSSCHPLHGAPLDELSAAPTCQCAPGSVEGSMGGWK